MFHEIGEIKTTNKFGGACTSDNFTGDKKFT